MGWTKGKPRKVVGAETRHDAAVADVSQVWRTDVVENQDPGFSYQFMRENEVHDRQRSKRVLDRRTGELTRVAGWTVVQEGEVEVSRERPDLAAPTDTAMRMGPHVLMKIPVADWEMLQHEKDAVPDAHAERMLRGGTMEQDLDNGITIRQPTGYAAHPALMGGLQGG